MKRNEEVSEILRGMFTAARESEAGFQAACEAAPKETWCEKHALPMPFDLEKARAIWRDTGQFTPCFKQCVACQLEEREKHRKAWLEAHGVPPTLRHCSFQNWRKCSPAHEEALAIAQQIISNDRGMLVLLGGTRSGKSHLAVAMLAANRTGRFIPIQDLIAAHNAGPGQTAAQYIRNTARNGRMVVFDDWRPLDAMLTSKLIGLLISRNPKKMITVVTSPLNAALFASYIGESAIAWLRKAKAKMVELTTGEQRSDRDEETKQDA